MARPSLTALRSHLNVPLFRDGYALVANEGVTAALGLVYWLVAAHEYSPHTVGVQSAVLSAMLLLAGIGQLSLGALIVRIVPLSQRATARFVLRCYDLGAALSVWPTAWA